MNKNFSNRSVDDLLAMSNDQFVIGCYNWILHREPDPEGLSHYLMRVHAGEDKLTIAAGMASSEEAACLSVLKKTLMGQVLARHAIQLLEQALFQGRQVQGAKRDAAAKQAAAVKTVEHYFSVLSSSAPVTSSTGEIAELDETSDDPFEQYLSNVIQVRSQ